MPQTRAMSVTDVNIIELLDKKFIEWKADIAMKECIIDLKNIITKQNETIDNLEKLVGKQNDKIDALDGHVKILQNAVNLLKRGQEEQEQYGRRLCLCIEGIKPLKNEDADSCLEKVKEVIESVGIDIPDGIIDREHRIGKPYKNHKNEECHLMIVRFTTWRHRTKLYHARDKSRNAKYKIRLDLTQTRYGSLLKTIKLLSWVRKDQLIMVFMFKSSS